MGAQSYSFIHSSTRPYTESVRFTPRPPYPPPRNSSSDPPNRMIGGPLKDGLDVLAEQTLLPLLDIEHRNNQSIT